MLSLDAGDCGWLCAGSELAGDVDGVLLVQNCLWPALPFMLFPLIPSCVALPIVVSPPAASAADIALREGLLETRYSSDLLCCARYTGRWALVLGNVLLILNV
ncbi:hypothetical protein Nepgr_017361 [Nepenthes gracilis]|uniref:Uncharacterized protein n=1 Tax=Nepenthes gracilis TaxID=150966 RepID=A0AAD3SRA6_NEPGR|nr:hypothetical protein Nepgr_017361 [Nepenthes gracilis]